MAYDFVPLLLALYLWIFIFSKYWTDNLHCRDMSCCRLTEFAAYVFISYLQLPGAQTDGCGLFMNILAIYWWKWNAQLDVAFCTNLLLTTSIWWLHLLDVVFRLGFFVYFLRHMLEKLLSNNIVIFCPQSHICTQYVH